MVPDNKISASHAVTHDAVLQEHVHASHFVAHFFVFVVGVERRPDDQVVAPVAVEVRHGEAVAEVGPELVARDVLQVDEVMRVDRDLGA